MSNAYIGNAGENAHERQYLLSKMGNRHGLIAGATGTGKTVTLQVLAEEFSMMGVPVFLSDIKGDVSGICLPGSEEQPAHSAFQNRANLLGIELAYQTFPVAMWDVYGEQGKEIKASLRNMGPRLVSSLFELTQAQTGTLNIAFKVAQSYGSQLHTVADLRKLLPKMANDSESLSLTYGNVGNASVGAIQRQLLMIENQGGLGFFSKDPLNLADFIQIDENGKGQINILAADKLIQNPKMYAIFLLWLLDKMYKELPEVGNPEKPKIVFFFDEAHLLFSLSSKPLLQKVEQIVRLIRSKGVGVYFVTQRPDDIPENVLSQLGNRVQHALRSFTGRDRRELKSAAETYRNNPEFDVATKISQLGVGEAVTSLLDRKGIPGVARHTFIRPPFSHVGPVSTEVKLRHVYAKSSMDSKDEMSMGRPVWMKTPVAAFFDGVLSGLQGKRT